MSVAIDCFAPVNSVLGEGPVWDERTGTLYWVDIKAPALFATEVAARQTRRWPMPERIGAIGLREGNGLVGAFKSGFALIDLPAGTREIVVGILMAAVLILRPTGLTGGRELRLRGVAWRGSASQAQV